MQPNAIEDLANHALIGFDDTMAKHRIATWLREVAPESELAARNNDVLGVVYLAKAVIGVAPLPIAPRVAPFFDFIVSEIHTLRSIITG